MSIKFRSKTAAAILAALTIAMSVTGCGDSDSSKDSGKKEADLSSVSDTDNGKGTGNKETPEEPGDSFSEETEAEEGNNLFRNGLAKLSVKYGEGGFYGFMNKNFEWAIEPWYGHSDGFYKGLACTTKNSQGYIRGFLDTDGNWAIEPIYADARNFSEGLAAAKDTEAKLYGYINKYGEWVIEPKFYRAGDFSNGITWASVTTVPAKATDSMSDSDIAYGIIDTNGDWIVEPTFSYINNFSEGLAWARQDDKKGYINEKGEWVIENSNSWEDFSEGLVRIYDEATEKYGYLDKTGNLAIEPKFEHAYNFSDGLAIACNDEKIDENTLWGCINTEGKWVIEPKFLIEYTPNQDNHGNYFVNGFANVKDPETKKYGIINKKGEWTAEPQFSDISGIYDDGYALATDDENNHLIIDTQGNILCNYGWVLHQDDDDNWTIIDSQRNVLYEIK